MSTDVETMRVAERAAVWLVRLDTASPQQLAEFWHWLTESPLHVQEMLAAQACHVELTRLLRKKRISSGKLIMSYERKVGSGAERRPHAQHNPLLEALRILATATPSTPTGD